MNGGPVKPEEMGYLVIDAGNTECQAFFKTKYLNFRKTLEGMVLFWTM